MKKMRGQPPMPPFALYLTSPQVWVDDISVEKFKGSTTDILWQSNGSYDVPILARRDGFIIFAFDAAERYAGGSVPEHDLIGGNQVPEKIIEAERARRELAYRRFEYMNAFMLAFSSGMSIVQHYGAGVQTPADPSNHFKGLGRSGRWEIVGLHSQKFDFATARSTHVKVETLRYAVDVMTKCESAFGDSFIDILSLTYTACHQFSLHQFASAHLIAWCVVEKLVNRMWSDLQKEIDVGRGGHTRVDKERRKLFDSRDYTASVISQILSITNKIDDPLLDRLNKARKIRNNFAHSLDIIASDDAADVIRLTTDLVSRLIGSQVTSQLSMRFWV